MKKCMSMIAVLCLVCGIAGAQQVLSFDEAIQQVVKDIESNVKPGTKIAVLSIESDKEAFSNHAIGEITTALVRGRKLTVVSRREIEAIRKEMQFQLSGDVSDESAQSIGKMLGAQTVIIGSFVRMGNNYRLRVNGISTQSAQYESSVSMTVNGRDDAVFLLTGEIAPAPVVQPTTTAQSAPAPLVQPTTTVQPAPAPKPVQTQSAAPAPTAGKTYKVGDQGPAGGIVFFDAGLYMDGWRYLEAAPADIPSTWQWGAYGKDVSGTSTEVGSGKRNTQLIVDYLKQTGESRRAAQLCQAYENNGYKDWFLPSKDELNWMYVNLKKKGLGGFTDSVYWLMLIHIFFSAY
ncbi:hypothetical protein FACS1894200_09320 [Spirochaetia bacterium]|nr:hypothetical protein FACS1894200_09320 [Spirochaetia bacterium]